VRTDKKSINNDSVFEQKYYPLQMPGLLLIFSLSIINCRSF
jgi:hypothetical protein